ncbi:PucR family transcriptional regulator [Streptomyces sp. SID6673]|nr:PucR family transcriptional regulator [Streptomyces sp. SID11726]NEB26531.1 PucR family transcriptional regulator [Streptomyces sp. SID6673]
MEPHPRLTLGGLLDEALMEGARVVSDRADALAPVTWALPFAEVMTRYDDLSATVVYARPESLAAKPTSMGSLAARSATAIIVDGPLPAAVTPEQIPADLVVIEMGFPIGFSALNRLLAERTLTQEVHVMRYATHVHQSLAGLLHRGAGMSMLLREVSALSHSPALVFDARCEIVAHNGLEKETLELVAPAVRDRLTEREDIRDHHDAATMAVSTPDGQWTCTVAPIRLGKYFEGWVVILDRGDRPGDHELAQHEVVASQATAIIGSEMLRQRSVEEAEERARGDFVQALVHGGFGNEYEMRTRAEYHDIDLDATFAVFVTRTSASRADGSEPQADRTLLRLARYAASLMPHRDVRSYITVLGDIVVVVRTIRGTTPAEVDEEVRQYAVAMADDLTSRGHALSAVAYGAASAGATQIRESYREARVALDIADRMHITGAVAYQELRSFGVLEQIADSERSREFTAAVLGPIRLGTELHTVLLAYLEHGGNVNAAARALNMHRNTMLSKLDRLSRASGCDIRVPENQFTVWLALRLELLDSLGSSLAREMSYR